MGHLATGQQMEAIHSHIVGFLSFYYYLFESVELFCVPQHFHDDQLDLKEADQ